jgi:tRNA-2-methylthio-N6-dimethylallyladenosine synthase
MSHQDSTTNHTYFLRTFGCQMNVHDSEHIAGVLEQAGYLRAPAADAAEVVIFNTCCVRQSAEDRVWGNLGALSRPADSTPRVVAVCGCMAERHGAGIMTRSQTVNLVFGMEALPRLPELIEASMAARVIDIGDVNEACIDCLPAIRARASQAWVPLSHGCDNNCAYCVVPAVRGAERCRPPLEILDEVRELASAGVVEVILLGQNVNSYRSGTGAGSSFAELLEAVASIEGIERVKFETSHPRDLGDDILEAMSSVPELCEYLHLPVQSGSDRVLAAMNRGYGRDRYMELATRARQRVGGLVLTTDLIVGFPGETERDFADTLDLVERVAFDAAYMFIYSEREGTPAARMGDEVPEEVKRRRFAELAGIQEGITARSLQMVVGHDVEVVVDGPSKRGDLMTARTRGHQVVLVPPTGGAEGILTAHVHEAGRHSLRGTVVAGGEHHGRES